MRAEAARAGGASEQERDAIETLISGTLGDGGVHAVVAQMLCEDARRPGGQKKRSKGPRGAEEPLSAAAVAAADASERAAAEDSGASLAALEAALSASLARQRALAAAAEQEEGAAALVHMLAKLHLLREKPSNVCRLLEELQSSRGCRRIRDADGAPKRVPWGLPRAMVVTHALASVQLGRVDGAVLALVEHFEQLPPLRPAATCIAVAMQRDGVNNLDAGVCGFAERRRRLYGDAMRGAPVPADVLAGSRLVSGSLEALKTSVEKQRAAKAAKAAKTKADLEARRAALLKAKEKAARAAAAALTRVPVVASRPPTAAEAGTAAAAAGEAGAEDAEEEVETPFFSRPRGAGKKGHRWDSATGRWVLDAAAYEAAEAVTMATADDRAPLDALSDTEANCEVGVAAWRRDFHQDDVARAEHVLLLARTLAVHGHHAMALRLYRKLAPRDYRGFRDATAFDRDDAASKPRRCVPTAVRGELARAAARLALASSTSAAAAAAASNAPPSAAAASTAASAARVARPAITIDTLCTMHRCILRDSAAIVSAIRLPVRALAVEPETVAPTAAAGAAAALDAGARTAPAAAAANASRPPPAAIMEQIRLRFCTPLQLLRAAQSSRNGEREMEAARHVACSLARLLLAQRSARLAAGGSGATASAAAATSTSDGARAAPHGKETELNEITLLAARHGLLFTRDGDSSAIALPPPIHHDFDPRTKNAPGKRRRLDKARNTAVRSTLTVALNSNASNLAASKLLRHPGWKKKRKVRADVGTERKNTDPLGRGMKGYAEPGVTFARSLSTKVEREDATRTVRVAKKVGAHALSLFLFDVFFVSLFASHSPPRSARSPWRARRRARRATPSCRRSARRSATSRSRSTLSPTPRRCRPGRSTVRRSAAGRRW